MKRKKSKVEVYEMIEKDLIKQGRIKDTLFIRLILDGKKREKKKINERSPH